MIAESWTSLLRLLDVHVPRFRPTLRPGADGAALAALEDAIGHALPDEVRRFLAIHDGQGKSADGGLGGELLATHTLSSCATIAKFHRFWYRRDTHVPADAHLSSEERSRLEASRSYSYIGLPNDGRFIEITESDGDAFLVDVMTGEVFFHVRGEGVFGPIASSLSAFFDDLAARLRDGRAVVEDSGTEDAAVWVDDYDPCNIPDRFPRVGPEPPG